VHDHIESNVGAAEFRARRKHFGVGEGHGD
jgi:hypothetical protein